ncbi:MAG: response regulator [Spirochaetaceae bacterium]
MKDKFEDLRRRAESFYEPKSKNLPDLSQEEVHNLIHELNTSQIELEMQNEDLRNTQIELEESKQKYLNLYDYAPVGYLTLNKNKQIIESNITACEMFGIDKEDIIESDFTSFIFDEDQDIFYLQYNQLTKLGEKQSSKIRLKKKDSGYFYSQLECVIRPEVDGNNGQFRIIITDITKLTEAGDALLLLKNQLSSIIESMPSIIVSVDSDCKIILCNNMAILEADKSKENIIGQKISCIFPHLSSVVFTISESIKSGEIISEQKHSYMKNDSIVYQDITIYPLNEINTKGAVIRIDDVTEIKRNEKILSHNEKMLSVGVLAAGIAHDFNNILTGINGAAQLLKLPDMTIDDKYLKYVDIIIQASNRAKDLTAKLLTYSSNDSDKTKTIDLCEIVDDAADLLKSSIDKKITISINNNIKSCYIKGDKTTVQNALINIGINSSHSIKGSGSITFNITKINMEQKHIKSDNFTIEPGEYYQLSIKDTGCGIPKEHINSIFDPFYTTKEQGKGTGLGLSVVYGTVRALNGFIEVESNVGSGTLFKLFFPVAYEESDKSKKDESFLEGNGLILVVDDEEIIRTTIKCFFEYMGYKILLAKDGMEAVDIFKKSFSDIDLVLMDMTMPKMNGSEAFYKMRTIDENCKVIIASGYVIDENIEVLLTDGLSSYIQKPYNMSQLSTFISKLINNS